MPQPSEYLQRRKKLAEEVSEGLILLCANQPLPRNYPANSFPFRQDSTFLYFTGLDQPGFCLLIDCHTGGEILFGHDPGIEDTIWSGPQPGLREIADKNLIAGALSIKDLHDHLQVMLKKGIPLHYLPPYPPDRILFLSQLLSMSPDTIKKRYSVPLIRAVVAQREIKNEFEVREITDALDLVTGPMHKQAMKKAVSGVYEHEIVSEMQMIAAAHQLEFAYGIICSVRGETLHNENYNNILEKDQLLLIDAGVESKQHYASDITRTVPVNGRFNKQQREIYEIVLKAQLRAIDLIRPGTPYRDIHFEAAAIIAEGLKDMGIMKGDIKSAVAEGAHALFFPHGLGHMIGLDVHDMEDLGEDYVGYDQSIRRSEQFGTAYLRLAKPLKSGFVLTVEPGIYFIPALIDQWQAQGKHEAFIDYNKLDSFRNFGGVRIEDNILVTATGSEILGQPVPKTADELESFANA